MYKACVVILFIASKRAGALRAGAFPGRRHVLTSAAAAVVLPAAPPSALAGDPSAAIFAQRFSVSGTVSPLPPIGQYSRYSDQLSTPKGSKVLSINMQFDFPQQLQQIGRALGGIQFVDGNSGLKVYILRAPLPGTSLADTPKKWFGESIFSPDGQIVREGVEIDAFKVTSTKLLEAPPAAVAARRRLTLKYTVITPANQRATDRFAFVDAYEVSCIHIALQPQNKWEDSARCSPQMHTQPGRRHRLHVTGISRRNQVGGRREGALRTPGRFVSDWSPELRCRVHTSIAHIWMHADFVGRNTHNQPYIRCANPSRRVFAVF